MKYIKTYTTTAVAFSTLIVIGVILIESAKQVKDFECKNPMDNSIIFLQYDKESKKLRYISRKEKEGAREEISGVEFNANEKNGVVFAKTGSEGWELVLDLNKNEYKTYDNTTILGYTKETIMKCKRI